MKSRNIGPLSRGNVILPAYDGPLSRDLGAMLRVNEALTASGRSLPRSDVTPTQGIDAMSRGICAISRDIITLSVSDAPLFRVMSLLPACNSPVSRGNQALAGSSRPLARSDFTLPRGNRLLTRDDVTLTAAAMPLPRVNAALAVVPQCAVPW